MNEIEVFLNLVEHMIKEQMKDSVGVKKDSLNRMKCSKMLKVLGALKVFVRDWGEVHNNSICKLCDNFRPTGEYYGTCMAKDRDVRNSVHVYHTCWRNTSSRWDKDKEEFVYPMEEQP